MPRPTRVTIAHDVECGDQAIYVNGKLATSCNTMYAYDVAEIAGDRTVKLEFVEVEEVEGEDWPQNFKRLTPVEKD